MLKRKGKGGNTPVRYVAFDVLYRDFEPLVHLPFTERRLILEELMSRAAIPQLVLSEGVRGGGRKLYQSACEQGLEGGRGQEALQHVCDGQEKRRLDQDQAEAAHTRSDHRIHREGRKRLPESPCGERRASGRNAGEASVRGRVGGGFTAEARDRINRLLRAHPSATPLVACPERGRWIEPGLYCEVKLRRAQPRADCFGPRCSKPDRFMTETSALNGKEVALTGRLVSMSRAAAIERILHAGGLPAREPGPATHFLVAGEAAGHVSSSGSLPRNLKLFGELKKKGSDIRLIDEQEFLRLLGDEPDLADSPGCTRPRR